MIMQCKKLYRNLRISQKLFLAFSLLIAVPAIIVSFLFIRTQETQLYKEAMTAGNNHITRLNVQLRNRMDIVENTAATALAQKSFVDFIHSDMREDGLRLVKFKQNQFEQMHTFIQSNKMISELSFYVDNANIYEIWPEIYHYDKFWPQDYWMKLRDDNGASFRLFAFKDGDHTLSFYRIVRLQGQQQKRPSIMEVRSSHSQFFGDLLEETGSDFFSIVVDQTNPTQYIYHHEHEFLQKSGEHLQEIIASFHPRLDVLKQTEPIKVTIAGQTYYGLYRYIAPLHAYVIDIASHQTLMKGPRNWYLVVIAITVFILLLMLLLVSQSTKRIFRRLHLVLASMRKVRQGQLDAKIDTGLTDNASGDEIDEVAVSYNSMLDEVQRLMTQVVDKQLIAKNAQLHSLHSQINSHFLYNALESIRMQAEVKQQPAIADALVSLGSLLRYSMKWHSDTVLLREELANIESYIRFINFMNHSDFKLTCDLSEAALNYPIPKMCMQPIVENIVHHAAPSGNPIHIQISTEIEKNRTLLIRIRDNGIGVDPIILQTLQAALKGDTDTPIVASKNGLGLENVHKRLQLHYSKEYGLHIDSVIDVFTVVTIRLPWESINLGGW